MHSSRVNVDRVRKPRPSSDSRRNFFNIKRPTLPTKKLNTIGIVRKKRNVSGGDLTGTSQNVTK